MTNIRVSPLDKKLLAAAKIGDIQEIERLICEDRIVKVDIDTRDEDGMTPLLLAAAGGHTEAIALLVANEAGINHENKRGHTFLICAARNGHSRAVEFILNCNGVKLNDKNSKGLTALMFAAKKGHKEVVEVLLQHGAQDDIEVMTALMFAAKKGHKEVVEVLLQHGVKLDGKDYITGMTALMFAAQGGHSETLEFLLKNGAEIIINARDKNGMTAAMRAALKGWTQILSLLLTYGADINLQDNMGNTVAIHAVRHDRDEVIKLLLNYRPAIINDQINGQYYYNETILRYAASNGHKKIVEAILNSGANIEDSNRLNALKSAVFRGHDKVIELFLIRGTNRDHMDAALITAIGSNRTKAALLLLKSGAAIVDNNGGTVLRHAVIHQSRKTLNQIILYILFNQIEKPDACAALLEDNYLNSSYVQTYFLDKGTKFLITAFRSAQNPYNLIDIRNDIAARLQKSNPKIYPDSHEANMKANVMLSNITFLAAIAEEPDLLRQSGILTSLSRFLCCKKSPSLIISNLRELRSRLMASFRQVATIAAEQDFGPAAQDLAILSEAEMSRAEILKEGVFETKSEGVFETKQSEIKTTTTQTSLELSFASPEILADILLLAAILNNSEEARGDFSNYSIALGPLYKEGIQDPLISTFVAEFLSVLPLSLQENKILFDALARRSDVANSDQFSGEKDTGSDLSAPEKQQKPSLFFQLRPRNKAKRIFVQQDSERSTLL
jgi:ankyrin repeat protein